MPDNKPKDEALKIRVELLEKQISEREKELNCLKKFSDTIENNDHNLPEIFNKVINIIPDAWQYPEITSVRIVFDDCQYTSQNFKESDKTQKANIQTHKIKRGQIEVFYADEKPDAYEGPFLKEERNLLNMLAERLGRVAERHETIVNWQNSETRFRELFQNDQRAIIIYNSLAKGSEFIIKNANKTAEKLDDLKAEDIIGLSVQEALPKNKAPIVKELLNKVCRTGKPVKQEHLISKAPGINEWREYYVYKISTGELITAYRDITKEKEMGTERALTIKLLQHLHAGKSKSDMLLRVSGLIQEWCGCKDVSILLRNGKKYMYYKYQPGTAELKTADLSFTQEKNVSKLFDKLANGKTEQSLPVFTENHSLWYTQSSILKLTSEETYKQTRTLLDKLGQKAESFLLIPIKYKDQFLGFIQASDIRQHIFTEKMVSILEQFSVNLALAIFQQETANALYESRKQYKLLVENQNDFVIQTDLNFKILYISPSIIKFFGEPESKLVGRSFLEISEKKDIELLKKEYKKAIKPPYYSSYTKQTTINNQTYTIEWSGSAVFNKNGEITSVVSVGRDITALKQVEQTLKQSEARFKEIFQSVKEGIIYFDTKGKVIFANEALENITGVPVSELEGKNAFHLARKFVSGKQLPQLIKKVAQAVSGQSLQPFELPYNNKIIEISANYAKNSNRITSSLRDVTAAREAKIQLAESEKKYRNIFENAPVGVFQTNAKGEVLLINFEMARILGFDSADEAIKYYYNLGEQLYVHAEKREQFLKQIKKHGSVDNFEYQAKKKNGAHIWLSMNARIAKKAGKDSFIMEGFTSDITQRKKAEIALKEQKLLFEAMFHSITDAIIITDTQKKIILANKGLQQTFGYKTEAIEGESTKKLLAHTEKTNISENTVAKSEDSPAKDFYIASYKRADGTIFSGETFGRKLYDSKGAWIGNLEIIRDISERQNFIQQLEAAKNKAEQSDQLKSAFLANMSHEIRTPMNGILGFAQMFLHSELNRDKQKRYAKIIIDNTKQLLTIVNDILDISLIEAEQMRLVFKETDIKQLCKELHDLYDHQAVGKNIDLKYIVEDQISPEIETDPVRLKQILGNLIHNAIKFTSEGFVEFGFKQKNSEILFSIKDSGIGIDAEVLDEMFDRFRQEELQDSKKLGGTGLGLSISKKLVELLGGKIWAESKKGRGSKFFITIPVEPKKSD